MSKTIFSQGTILTPDVANSWQNPQFVSKADFPATTTQLDLNDGQFFTPQIQVSDILTTSTDDDDVLKSDGNNNIIVTQMWGGYLEEPALGTVGPGGGVPITVKAGTIVAVDGTLKSFNDTIVELSDGVYWIYIDDDGNVQTDTMEPPRQTPHTSLANITISGTQVASTIDLRPHKYVGAHNDTPLALTNTPTQTANYQAVSFDRVIMDNSGGSYVVTVPQTPLDGDRIAIYDLMGAFNNNPLILSPGTATATISGTSDEWIFTAPYTYIELVYLLSENTWAFRSIPDTTCKNRGVFIKCGGVISTISNQLDCENFGYDWKPGTSQCFRFNHMGAYSDGNGGSFEVHHDERCAQNYDTEFEGRFLRCDGTTAVYDRGNAGGGAIPSIREELLVENARRCGGAPLGKFIECRLNTTIDQSGILIYDGIYEDALGTGEVTVEGDDRCIEVTDPAAKQGNFVQCLGPGAVNFGDQTVPVGVYNNDAGVYDYLFNDPRCRDITTGDVGRFLQCDGTAAIYQASDAPAGGDLDANPTAVTGYRKVDFDPRCYDASDTGRIAMFYDTASIRGPWLLCDGGGYNPAAYPALNTLLTSAPFNLTSGTKPDFRDRSPYGSSDTLLTTLLSGSNNIVLDITQMPTHSHSSSIPDHTHTLVMDPHLHAATSPSHVHTFDAGNHSHTVNSSSHTHTFTPIAHNHNISGGTAGTFGEHAHTINIGSHVHTATLINHIHDPGEHIHGVPSHSHRVYSWIDASGEGLGEESDSLVQANAAITGENRGPGSTFGSNGYLTNNGSGTILLEVNGPGATLTRNAPTSNLQMTFGAVTAWNDATLPTGVTDAGGSVSTTTGITPTTNAWSLDDASAGGTIGNSPVSGTSDPTNVSGVVDGTSATITVQTETSTGTNSLASLSATIGTQGSSASVDIRHAIFHVNFYIHV